MRSAVAIVVCFVALQVAQGEGLPAPTGPHKIGRASFHWVDENREELETKAPDDTRELMVHVFYPADPGAAGDPAVYVPDATDLTPPWTPGQLASVKAVVTHCFGDAPILSGGERLPVAVFAPGGGMKALTYHALLEDLASHGWAVAAIDPPYNARAVRIPDGRVLGNLPPEERTWGQPKGGEQERQFYIDRILHWSRDVSFVIDRLSELDRGDGPFAGRLDVDRGVGVFGHSRGGHMAGAVRLTDNRVLCGINIDGTAGEFVVLPITGDEISGVQPFMWIQNAIPDPPSDEQLQRAGRTRAEYDAQVEQILSGWDRRLGEVEQGAVLVRYTRRGVDHIDFSDEPIWFGNVPPEAMPGKLQTIAEARAWIRAFLDATIRGERDSLDTLLVDANRTDSGLAVSAFGALEP